MKKLICIFIIVPFLFISCVVLGDTTNRTTLKYLNNASGEISISRIHYDYSKDQPTLTETPLGIIPIGESLSLDPGIFYSVALIITCNGKKVIQYKKDNAPLFDTIEYECIFYEKIREPNTCYIITPVYQFEFTDDFFKDCI